MMDSHNRYNSFKVQLPIPQQGSRPQSRSHSRQPSRQPSPGRPVATPTNNVSGGVQYSSDGATPSYVAPSPARQSMAMQADGSRSIAGSLTPAMQSFPAQMT